MQKTKLGISVGLLGAAAYFSGLFGGYVVAVLLAGYALLFEENKWLRRAVIKAVALLIFFSLITTLINLIPDGIGVVDNVFAVFHGSFKISFVTSIISMLTSVIYFVEKVLFIGLGLKALTQGTIAVPIIDKLIEKNIE